MGKSSRFGLKIDFEKSQGSLLYDKNSGRQFLDFFGQYSSLVLGYNHPVFHTAEFKKAFLSVAHTKVTNCEILSDEAENFDQTFGRFACDDDGYKFRHYSCTGALAVEAALKTAIDYKPNPTPQFISFKGSFHGINSYGGFVTDRCPPVDQRLNGFPKYNMAPFDSPVQTYENNIVVNDEAFVQRVLDQLETELSKNKTIVAILLEPIQCTVGDRTYPESFFLGLRALADRFDIPLIFDEIQVGFCSTGKVWYYQNCPVQPDILVFGKKAQLSGIAVKEKFAKIFETPIRLEVTWDATVEDMLRCETIIQVIEKEDILSNVQNMASLLNEKLKRIPTIENLRHCGLLFAFDLPSSELRNSLSLAMFDRGMLCNPTGEKTIRLRPPLNVTVADIETAASVILSSAEKIESKKKVTA